MLQQAVGKTATLALLESDSLTPSLSDTPTDRSSTAFNLDPCTQSEPFNTDSSNTDILSFDSLDTDTLNIADAPVTDSLFDLGSAAPLKATSNTTALAGTYSYPIEWGDPLTDQYYWRQQSGKNSCAVVAQISAYRSLTGGYVTEQDACNYAQARGWFDPQSGTLPSNTGKILNVLGISTVQKYDATLNDIAIALSKGDKPIVALDGNEIWNPMRDWYGNPVEQTLAGHAVWVTGIDRTANGSYSVILNDSAVSYGRSEVVSYADFNNAWTDYNHFLTVADNPLT